MNLNEKQKAMIVDLIERVSLNGRSFDKEDEKTLKEIAEYFGAEYDEELNLCDDEEDEEEVGVENEKTLNFVKASPIFSVVEPTKVVVYEEEIDIYYNKCFATTAKCIDIGDIEQELKKMLKHIKIESMLDDFCIDDNEKVLEVYLA